MPHRWQRWPEQGHVLRLTLPVATNRKNHATSQVAAGQAVFASGAVYQAEAAQRERLGLLVAEFPTDGQAAAQVVDDRPVPAEIQVGPAQVVEGQALPTPGAGLPAGFQALVQAVDRRTVPVLKF